MRQGQLSWPLRQQCCQLCGRMPLENDSFPIFLRDAACPTSASCRKPSVYTRYTPSAACRMAFWVVSGRRNGLWLWIITVQVFPLARCAGLCMGFELVSETMEYSSFFASVFCLPARRVVNRNIHSGFFLIQTISIISNQTVQYF